MFEYNSTKNVLLQQFNNDEYQKSLYSIRDINNLHISSSIVKRRRKNWNNLFKKYCSKLSDTSAIDFKMINFQQNKETVMPQQLAQKPISMIQYWVDTGKQPYSKYFDNQLHSNQDFPSKQEVVKKYLKIASTSCSSVDTADYILAYKNTIKKKKILETLRGRKNVNKKFVYKIDLSKSARNNSYDTKYFKNSKISNGTTVKDKLTERKTISSSIQYNKNIEINGNNLMNPKIEQKDISKKSKILNNENNYNIKNTFVRDMSTKCEKIHSKISLTKSKFLLFSDSDETDKSKSNRSQSRNSQETENEMCKNSSINHKQTKISLFKTRKRKKLFNSTRNFENISIKEQNLINNSTIYWKKFEHPALEINKCTLKSLKQTKNQRQYMKHEERSLKSEAKIKVKHKLFESSSETDNNECNTNSNYLKQANTKNYNSTICNTTLQNAHNNETVIENKKLCIELRRLPYKYENINPIKKNIMETKKNNEKKLIENIQNIRINFNPNFKRMYKNYRSNEKNYLKTFTKNIKLEESIPNTNGYNLENNTVKKFSFYRSKQNSRLIKNINKKSKMVPVQQKIIIRKFKKQIENFAFKDSTNYTSDLSSDEIESRIKFKNNLSTLKNKILSKYLENKRNCKNTDNNFLEKIKYSTSVENLNLIKEFSQTHIKVSTKKKSNHKQFNKFAENKIPNKTKGLITRVCIFSSNELQPIKELKNDQTSNKISNECIKNKNSYTNLGITSCNKSMITNLEKKKSITKFSIKPMIVSKNKEYKKKKPHENYLPIFSSSDEFH